MVTARLVRKGKGFDKLKARIEELAKGGEFVKVGILGGGKKRDGGLSNAELAAVHEFGAPSKNIPARPFVIPSMRKNRDMLISLLGKLVSRAALQSGPAYHAALGVVGQKAAAEMKNFVTGGAEIPPPNAPATLKRKQSKTRRGSKGEARTLVDTGRMVNAITYQVVTGGK